MRAEYRFRFSEDHLLTTFLRYRQQLWWRRPFLGLKWILAGVFGLPLLFAVYKSVPILAVFCGAVLGTLLLGWPIDAWIIRRRFRKSPFYNDQIALSLLETGAYAVGQSSEVRIDWVNFTKARRFKDGLLLFQGAGAFNWLPDAAAADATAVANAQELARLNIPDYRDV